ncbi:MAG: dephospho-CoA kinase [Gammaproteobacteria bacterium]|nr:dephospho-CoA kinase [Gammaproteobacteria bacterium]
MLVVGLTGGIGSGKTTVANGFAALGVPLIDADEIARDLVAPGRDALKEIVACFGSGILDGHGGLDRARLRQRIFTDPGERRRLEAILHPRIRTGILARIRQLDAPYCIVSIPLLVETGQSDLVDRVLVVDCPSELQRERIARRDGWPMEEIEGALRAQASREQRLRAADDVIVNDGDLDSLRRSIATLHRGYLDLADAAPN